MSDNETLADQSNAEQLRIHKRRSSVFQVTRGFEDAVDEDSDSNENENTKDEEPLDLPAYIERLKNERKEWKEMLTQRKARRRKLQKEKSIIQRQGANYDLSLLSEAERSFLLERPPYENICKNINALTKGAVIVGTLQQEIEYMTDRLILNIERRVNNTTRKIIEMSSKVT